MFKITTVYTDNGRSYACEQIQGERLFSDFGEFVELIQGKERIFIAFEDEIQVLKTKDIEKFKIDRYGDNSI